MVYYSTTDIAFSSSADTDNVFTPSQLTASYSLEAVPEEPGIHVHRHDKHAEATATRFPFAGHQSNHTRADWEYTAEAEIGIERRTEDVVGEEDKEGGPSRQYRGKAGHPCYGDGGR